MAYSQRLMGAAGVLAGLVAPASVSAEPLRAGMALPAAAAPDTAAPDVAMARRAATPAGHASGLGPFSLLGGLLALTFTTVVVVVVATRGHSPG